MPILFLPVVPWTNGKELVYNFRVCRVRKTEKKIIIYNSQSPYKVYPLQETWARCPLSKIQDLPVTYTLPVIGNSLLQRNVRYTKPAAYPITDKHDKACIFPLSVIGYAAG